jgi:hypothetical protein
MPAAGMGFLGVILYVQPSCDRRFCAMGASRSCTNIKDVIRMSKHAAAGQALGVSRHDMLIWGLSTIHSHAR